MKCKYSSYNGSSRINYNFNRNLKLTTNIQLREGTLVLLGWKYKSYVSNSQVKENFERKEGFSLEMKNNLIL